ncbi:hypothetical protein G1K75_12710 [Tenacibaculum finnmarkense]|uniref:hypothetical protein n=1 Tax=Tenacibaculum finnmarkense TaxID=2781243 RepID=UPI00187B9755|nr:hypothetical protein [Tenacibaculum finnmarkense]MBE7635114.1 hypothetical protein [Tenacibaculum finnmarkense genomovar ulcerans]MCD8403800.1 hypothetical protein [Tenacibaculum finnmarkense genomovar finnmarkense]MCD8431117.1 hypothetical protein [Tenacibaculum finnmarkense genomovar ulcerans]MCD8433603.1 hypothetical protein [Tenacibaculum finnmarkense genomovar ulcerans]MCG8806513.1 hypothetical protein [Tenacibaculum finnmarkense]
MEVKDFIDKIEKTYKKGLSKAMYKDNKAFANLVKNTLYRIDFIPLSQLTIYGNENYLEFYNDILCYKVSGFDEALEFINKLTDNNEQNLLRATDLFHSTFKKNIKEKEDFYLQVELFQGIR